MFAYRRLNQAVHDLRLDLRDLRHPTRLQFRFRVPQNCDGVEQRCGVVVSDCNPACNIWIEIVGGFDVSVGC
jgi:hypothetical protein